MKRLLLIFMMLFFLLACISCQNIPVSKSQKLKVATSIFPIYDITKNIASDRADVFFVIPVGANPHTYEPVPAEIKRLKNVRLAIAVHEEFDGWLSDYLPEQAVLQFLKEEEHKRGQEKEHKRESKNAEKHEHGQGAEHDENPHIWLTVKGAEGLAERICGYLTDADPKNANYYNKNLQSYLQKLEDLDNRIAAIFAAVKNRKFIQWHPAWNFFAEDYGLEIIGSIEKGHGHEPSIKEFKALIDKAKREKVKVVVLGLNIESKATETLAREIDGIVVRLDSIGDPAIKEKSTYIRLMYHNAVLLADALNQ
jgi:zinc transport system substrate-binding protein